MTSDALNVLAEASATKDKSKTKTFIASPFGFELSPSISSDIKHTRRNRNDDT